MASRRERDGLHKGVVSNSNNNENNEKTKEYDYMKRGQNDWFNIITTKKRRIGFLVILVLVIVIVTIRLSSNSNPEEELITTTTNHDVKLVQNSPPERLLISTITNDHSNTPSSIPLNKDDMTTTKTKTKTTTSTNVKPSKLFFTSNNNRDEYKSKTEPELKCTEEEWQSLLKYYPATRKLDPKTSWVSKFRAFSRQQREIRADDPSLYFLLGDHSSSFNYTFFSNTSYFQQQYNSSQFSYQSFDDHQLFNTSHSTIFTHMPYFIEMPGFATIHDRYIWLCLQSTGMHRSDPPYQFIAATNHYLKNLSSLEEQNERLKTTYPYRSLDDYYNKVSSVDGINDKKVDSLIITPTTGKYIYIHKPEHLTGTFTVLKNVYWNPGNQLISQLWDTDHSCFYIPQNTNDTFYTLLQSNLKPSETAAGSIQEIQVGLYTLTPDSYLWQHHFDSLLVLAQSFKSLIKPFVQVKPPFPQLKILVSIPTSDNIISTFPDSYWFLSHDLEYFPLSKITIPSDKPYFFHSLLYPCGIPPLYHPYLVQTLSNTLFPVLPNYGVPEEVMKMRSTIIKPRKIYFFSRRDALRQRTVQNEVQVIEGIQWWIEKHNMESRVQFSLEVVYDKPATTFKESIELFNDESHQSPVMIGAHGGGLYNTVFCRNGVTVIEIAPLKREEGERGRGWMSWMFWGWTRGVGGKYYVVWGDTGKEGWGIDYVHTEKILWILEDEFGEKK